MGLGVNAHSTAIVHYVLFAAAFRGLCQSTSEDPGIVFVNETFDIFWDSYENSYTDETYTIKTEGCNIPGMNFLDPSIRKFVQYPTNVSSCSNTEHSLLANNQTYLRIQKENYPYYNITNDKFLNCCYTFLNPYVSKENEATKKKDHLQFKYSTCIKFTDFIEVLHEFVRIRCYHHRRIIYEQFFLFTLKKRFTIERENPFEYPEDQSPYNVLMLGLSSMSRLNFHRTMPNTLNYLNKKGVIEFKGYSSVADGFSNLVPVLAGLDYIDLESICWRLEQRTYDRCPFIWERFKDAGFYTAFIEDSTKFGILKMDRFGKGGFNHIPTDYYLRQFIQETEKEKKSSPEWCMGNKYYFRVILDYLKSLTATLNRYKLFGLFWESSMSNNNQMNFPMLMDHDYESLIKNFDSSGYLNETILILFSDHGIDVGDFYLTTQGQLEDRLPFLYILTPPSFRKKFDFAQENLLKNSKRLTTPFDLHSTLIDLIDLSSIENEEILRRTLRNHEYKENRKGTSFFLEIPSNRTCESAGINNKACVCLKIKRLPLNSIEAHDGSSFLIKTMNNLLNPYPECSRLSKDKVIEAMEMSNQQENETLVRDFVVIVRTTPGGGLFEAKLRARIHYHTWAWELVGPVSRRNAYAEQSFCVKDLTLKMFCYCYPVPIRLAPEPY